MKGSREMKGDAREIQITGDEEMRGRFRAREMKGAEGDARERLRTSSSVAGRGVWSTLSGAPTCRLYW